MRFPARAASRAASALPRAGTWARRDSLLRGPLRTRSKAVYEAFKRREVYASTGPRITLRFFGGFDFDKGHLKARDFAAVGYRKGVPMGGDLRRAERAKAPTFIVAAMKDPLAANLDRIQIVKGWLDADGKTHERIYDVAVSGRREISPDGRCATPVGNTVDLATGGQGWLSRACA